MEEVFTEIYDKNKWGGGSGTGSKMSRNNQKYIDILNEILNKYNIKTICDIGCGDWQFSKFIKYNTKDINYLGIDCVKSVIDNNLKDYKDTNINFEHKTISDKYIPENYDLIILKDVIQHWEDKDILKYISRILKNNKYVFVTNGYKFMRDKSKNNLKERNINNQYRYHPVDINKYPLSEYKKFCLQTYEYFSKQMNLLHQKKLINK